MSSRDNQHRESGRGALVAGVTLGLALVGVLLAYRELPALRRYVRMERM